MKALKPFHTLWFPLKRGTVTCSKEGIRMTKADIVEDIAQRTGLTKKEVGETVARILLSYRSPRLPA